MKRKGAGDGNESRECRGIDGDSDGSENTVLKVSGRTGNSFNFTVW